MDNAELSKTDVLIVGAGPAGLAAAITLKKARPQAEVIVIDKAASAGNHNLSGAALEAQCLETLLKPVDPQWRTSEAAQKLLARQVKKDNVMFMHGKELAFDIAIAIKTAKLLRLPLGQMSHANDYTVSISELCRYLNGIAKQLGVEIFYGFAAQDIIWDAQNNKTTGVKLVDQGLNHDGNPQPNYLPGETISANIVVLAEGCDGLLTEKFIEKAGLERQANQLYSVGVKELIKVRPEQYKKFGDNRIVHAMGYPIFTPVLGPGMFGGGIMYPFGDDHIAVGMIVGLDWKECNFNPQDALTNFKSHRWVRKYIEGGTVTEAGAKMIPEGGLFAVPRDPKTKTIGKSNVIILGDSAGFVNMCKIKGLHNAIYSGYAAGRALSEAIFNPTGAAGRYTEMLHKTPVITEMKSARNFRQTIARLGPSLGLAMSVFAGILPKFKIEKDYLHITGKKYKFKMNREFDKDTFTAVAHTEHREEQPSHLTIINRNTCEQKCRPKFGAPCITFCPAGVYETVHGTVRPANFSNCLHCKTCQRKCPFDNIRWTVPEGGGGPRYKTM